RIQALVQVLKCQPWIPVPVMRNMLDSCSLSTTIRFFAMLSFFRTVSIIEGLSYLVILCVTLGVISRNYVFVLGMTHGVLFMVYLVASLLASNSRSWSVLVWLALLLAALVPFAFIPVELFLRREAQIGRASCRERV